MPDLLNRTAHESHAARLLSSALDRQRRELLTANAADPSTPPPPQAAWEKYSDELIALYLLFLGGPWSESYYRLAGQYSVFTPGVDVERAYRTWADEHARREVGRIIAGSREIVDAARERIAALRAELAGVEGVPLSTGGVQLAEPLTLRAEIRFTIDAVRELRPVSDFRRSTLYGVSSVTDAASAGEFAVRDVFNAMNRGGGGGAVGGGKPAGPGTPGVIRAPRLVAYWVTERDGRVCKICRPLDGQPESVWGAKFPSGPKAHDICRCYLDWRLE